MKATASNLNGSQGSAQSGPWQGGAEGVLHKLSIPQKNCEGVIRKRWSYLYSPSTVKDFCKGLWLFVTLHTLAADQGPYVSPRLF